MWTVTIESPTRTITAYAVTRQDARNWARQYREPGDHITITPPHQEHQP